ncbi:MAG: c-type cytochrome biogenesis protein CcmI [Burkholderiales bacterium]|jgi:cytochrome c-type biogenesis protein CcmH
MLLFWIPAALLLAGALSALLWPLLRTQRAGAESDADAAAIAVFRDQKRALDHDFASGAITAVERDVALADLAQQVAEEIGERPHRPAAGAMPRRAWALALGLLVLVPALAILLYGRVGDPGGAVVAAAGDGGHELNEQQITAMIANLGQRLKQHPDDAEGWMLLARSDYALDRFTAAADAYAKANALVKDNADLLADYADALAMAQGRNLAGKPLALAESALAIDPRHKKALALAATAALEARDADKSIAYWRRLAAQLPPGSDEARQVAGVIAEVDAAKRGIAAPAQRSAAAGSAPAAAAASGAIGGRVELSPTLASRVTPTDTVFIFARAAAGPRMPLAVLRLPVTELPRDFRLDDSMGMAPGVKLSSAGEVVVEARVSRSGNALPQSGDLFGRSAPAKPGIDGLRITIDQVVP